MADTELIAAVRKLVKAKGRYHTEQNYLAVVAALDMHDAHAASTSNAPTVPEGYALVPIEADEDMIYEGGIGRRDQMVDAADVWRCMIRAALATKGSSNG